MKQDILKIAGVKSEAEFYKKFPSEEAFMKIHGKEFKKAKMGTAMVNKQLTQLTDFANPPQAQVGKTVVPQPTSADSARLYNAQMNLNKFYEKEVKAGRIKRGNVFSTMYGLYNTIDEIRDQNLKFYRNQVETRNSRGRGNSDNDYEEIYNLSPNQVANLELQGIAQTKAGNAYQQYYRDHVAPLQNLAAPFAMVDSRVKPQRMILYDKVDPDYPGGDVMVYDYDPLAIKPYGSRTPKEKEEWNKKYGGTKPTPQPTPKPTATGKPTPKPKTTPKKEQPVKKTENPPTPAVKTTPQSRPTPVVEKRQTSYEGSPVYSPGSGSGLPSSIVGFANQRGDTTYIQPQDYQRFAVSPSGKEYIESKSQKKDGGDVPKYQYSGPPLQSNQYRSIDFDYYQPMGAQFNPNFGGTRNNATYNNQTGMFNSTTGQVSMADTRDAGFYNNGNKTIKRTIQDLDANEINSGIQMGSMVGKNVQKISNAIEQKKKAKQLNALTPVITQAAGTRPERLKNKYVRPEDMMFDPNQMFPSYGTGTNVLAANGAMVGGNPTEIQNMYSSGDLYSDLGYEPLNDSDKVKQYKKGGNIPKAQMGVGEIMSIANEAGNMLGDATAGIIGIGTKRLNNQNEQMLGQAAFQSGMQNIQQNQFGAFMEDGGWVSNDWQPQTITKFGEYDVKDLLKDDPTMDTLRSGGHLKNYAAPSEEAMQTYDMGGELQTHWGGYAEPISYNPYLPDGGVTMMPRGQSHEESDGQGNTGIGITFGNNPVEVERGEPMVKLKDGGDQESLVVYGNMKIPSYGLSELNDPLAKGKKFKNYANLLSKKESKQNKIVEKGTKLIDESNPNDAFDLLKLNSAQAMVKGGNMKLKNYADKKILLSGVQNAILDTAKEMGVESDALAKGNIKQDKNSDMAKFGGKFTKAQSGILARPGSQPPSYRTSVGLPDPLVDRWSNLLQSAQNRTQPTSSIPMSAYNTSVGAPSLTALILEYVKDMIAASDVSSRTIGDSNGKKFDYMKVLRELQPYLIPSNQEALDPNQLSGEMLALATNQLQPVQAQQYTPQLETPYSVSFQDQMNANQADFNALQRQLGYNPAAASQLAAQKYAANSAILGQQARANQEMQMGAYNRNRGVLNDSTLKNLAILDSQYQRQEQAKSNTKMQAQVALNSIADKIAKNKLENKILGVMENMYNYRFGPKGRAYNVNAPYEFDTQLATMSADEIQEIADKRRESEKKSGSKTARNGSIVKAIKNL